MTNEKSKKEKGISRIDSATTRGWLVRGYKNGKRYSKLFSDKKLGDTEKALDAAKVYRDQLVEKLESIPSKPRAKKIVLRDSRNSTGVIGVSRLSKKGKNGNVIEFYSVTWRPAPCQQKCTSFSIRKYGPDLAFKKAVTYRYEMLKSAHGPKIANQIVGVDNVKKYVLKEKKVQA